MSYKSYYRGHSIIFIDGAWIYEDNGNLTTLEPCAIQERYSIERKRSDGVY